MSLLLKINRQLMRTPLRRALDPHLAHPRGLLGLYMAAVMNRANVGITRFTLDQLGLEAGQQVLEIGFGGGVSFDLALPELRGGRLYGLDRSMDMLRRALRRRRGDVVEGRLSLELGSVDRLPYPEAAMDRVFGVNTLYFWPDPLAGLKEIRRVLKPGGMLALGLRGTSVFKEGTYSKKLFRVFGDEELGELYRAAGFKDFSIARTSLRGVETLAALGRKAGA